MKEISFLSGLVIALGMSLLVKVAYPLMALLCGGVSATHLTIAGCVTAYLWALTALSPRRSGRLISVLVVPALECALLLLSLEPFLFLLVSLVLLWIGRVALTARGPLDAFLEGFLVVVAVVFMGWAALTTGSLGLLTWCFFLVLAARPLLRIPRLQEVAVARGVGCDSSSRFERSHAVAEKALARLVG